MLDDNSKSDIYCIASDWFNYNHAGPVETREIKTDEGINRGVEESMSMYDDIDWDVEKKEFLREEIDYLWS